MKKIINVEEMKEKKKESMLLIRGTIIPLIIGSASLIFKISKIIGLVALAFGFIGGFFYFRRIYLRRKGENV